MEWPLDIVADLSPDRFREVFAASTRPVREAVLSRYSAKSAVRAGVSAARTADDRVKYVHRKLVADPGRGALQLADELLRNWLLARRALLCATLDELGVKHVNGVTNAPLDFVETLAPEKVQALWAKLVPAYDAEVVTVYLRYLKVPGAAQLRPPAPA